MSPAIDTTATAEVVFTVDVEPDWGVAGTRAIHEVGPRLLAFMDAHGITATFFVVGSMVEKCWSVLQEMGRRHEIASHGFTHRILSKLAPEEVRAELTESKRVLEERGWRVLGFRAPFFKTPIGWRRHLEGAGYLYDSSLGSVYPSRRNRNKLRAWALGSQRGNSGPAEASLGQRPSEETTIELPVSSLKDGLSPFSLTSLRLYDPFWRCLMPSMAQGAVFYFHLHELLDATPSPALTRRMRFVQQRNHGEKAWRILTDMVEASEARFVSCRDYIDGVIGRNRSKAGPASVSKGHAYAAPSTAHSRR